MMTNQSYIIVNYYFYIARLLLCACSIGGILLSSPMLLLLELSDVTICCLWDGVFIFPSHYRWYCETALLSGCIGGIVLSNPMWLLLELIDFGRSALCRQQWKRRMVPYCDCKYFYRVLLLVTSFACSIRSRPISLLIELLDIGIVTSTANPQNGFVFVMPSHWMWYQRMLLTFISIGCIILGKPIPLMMEGIRRVWMPKKKLLLLFEFHGSKFQIFFPINWTWRVNRLVLILRSVGQIMFRRPTEFLRTRLSSISLSFGIDCFSMNVREEGTHIQVDPSCTFFAERAFRGNTQSVHVKLCEGLQSVGSTAFRDCSSIKRIYIPSTVKVIGEYAFRGCTQLRTVGLKKGLERICDGSFVDCTSLERICIPNTVRAIGDWAFCSCRKLTHAKLPEGLERIGKWMFYDCTSLKQIKVPSTVKIIDEMTFINCVNLKKVYLCKGLVHIANNAFSSCASLKHIRIPSTVKVIGEVAFANCSKLEQVEFLGGLEDIGVEAFVNCIALRRINIPSTVKVIREKTFRGCVELIQIKFEEGLQQLLECAFESCISLESVKVPKSVTHIHPQAFLHCQNLIEVKFCSEVEDLVRKASIQWWNNGVSELSISTYSLLVEHKVPEQLGMLNVPKWHSAIYDMLRCIATVDVNSLDQYFDIIDSKVKLYEHLRNVATVLELVVWKSKLQDHNMNYPNSVMEELSHDMKLICRIKCGSTVIIPNVLSFLMQDG